MWINYGLRLADNVLIQILLSIFTKSYEIFCYYFIFSGMPVYFTETNIYLRAIVTGAKKCNGDRAKEL